MPFVWCYYMKNVFRVEVRGKMQLLGRSMLVTMSGLVAACIVVIGLICVFMGQGVIGAICVMGAGGLFMMMLFLNSQSPVNRHKALLASIGNIHTRMNGISTIDGTPDLEYELKFGESAIWVDIPDKIVTVVPYRNILSSNIEAYDRDIKMSIYGIGDCVFEHDNPLRVEAVKQWLNEKHVRAA